MHPTALLVVAPSAAVRCKNWNRFEYTCPSGYEVTNFFAPCSRFGTPEELKELLESEALVYRSGLILICLA